MEHYRADGVRITHDPFHPDMEAKYGRPGETDKEGFDPYADSVGPGIYGGVVKRDAEGELVIGEQYQGHNPKPGPVYAGGGYTPVNQALREDTRLAQLLDTWPDLVNDISTGGAQPLHMAGMSRANQASVPRLVEAGADIEALDTYGYTPLIRMASNNLATGAQALLEAGAHPRYKGGCGLSPLQCAKQSAAKDVIAVLESWGGERKETEIEAISVSGAGEESVNCDYTATSAATIPRGFIDVCLGSGWPMEKMWTKLNSGRTWYRADNEAYIYWNTMDSCWWIDKPDGMGVYKAKAPHWAPPQQGWTPLCPEAKILPKCVRTFRKLVK